MWKQIWQLTKVSLRNVGGWNRVIYGKDRREKSKLTLMLAVYVILGVFIAGYSGVLAYGLCSMGMAEIIPAYALAVVSIITLFFSMFTAGSVVFERKSYELLAALPIAPAAIVVSRFGVMYLQNFMMGLMVTAPVTVVYGVMVRPGLWFYLGMLLGAVLTPLLPMTIATLAGALISGISSRLKHKNLITILLSLALTIGIVVITGVPAFRQQDFSLEALRDLADLARTQIYGFYPPARLFAEGVTGGRPVSYLWFAGISIGAFLAMVYLVQRRFVAICTALYSGRTGGKRFEVGRIKQRSISAALYGKELSRYFASSIWVMNTIIGPMLMLVLAIALLIVGADKLEGMLQLPPGYSGMFGRMIPFFLAMLGCMSPVTVSSVSMEGKNWWLTQSLPITAKQLFDAKMLVNLTFDIPSLALSVILLFWGGAVGKQEAVWLILIPVSYVFFITVFGITVNCKLPNLQWESEVAVVKQSAAMLVCMGVGMLGTLLPMAGAAALTGTMYHGFMGVLCAVLIIATLILYRRNRRVDIRSIG